MPTIPYKSQFYTVTITDADAPQQIVIYDFLPFQNQAYSFQFYKIFTIIKLEITTF